MIQRSVALLTQSITNSTPEQTKGDDTTNKIVLCYIVGVFLLFYGLHRCMDYIQRHHRHQQDRLPEALPRALHSRWGGYQAPLFVPRLTTVMEEPGESGDESDSSEQRRQPPPVKITVMSYAGSS